MRSSFSALGLSVMFILSATGQHRPNLSGTWNETSNRYRDYIEKIVHRDSDLTIETTMREKPGPPTTLQRPIASLHSGPSTYVIEGAEWAGKNEKAEGWTSVYWQESSLIIQSVRKEGYRVTVTREMYTLSDAGDTLTKVRRVVNMDGVTETTTVLHRQ
ncbi:MAG: hypothetical protein JST11_11620 [Acidobacteria bacterium]|nr:hypothetical protein [Acidobacteriota bacterium]